MKVSTTLAGGLFIIFAAMPLTVLASPAYVSTSVNLRAGPGVNYPVVARIAGTSIVEVNGCVRDGGWCNVEWSSRRHRYAEHGWVSRRFLQAAYRNRKGRYAVNSHQYLSAPVVVFDIGSYWDSYYRDQDFYRDRGNYMPHDNRWDNNGRNNNNRNGWGWGHWNN